MNELREKNALVINIATTLSGVYGRSTEANLPQARLIRDTFKAHIEGCERIHAEISKDELIEFTDFGKGYLAGWRDSVEADRKALMESL